MFGGASCYIHLATLYIDEGSAVDFNIPVDQTIFFYVVKGAVTVNGKQVHQHNLVHFENDEESIAIKATSNAIVLLGYATPFKEPFMAHGPFVMNTREEIMQAYDDYQKGKFGDADALL